MFKRVLTSALGIPLLIGIVLIGGIPLFISIGIVTSIGLRELYMTFQLKNHKINIPLEIILGIGLLIIMDQYQSFILPYLVFLFLFHSIYQLCTKETSIENGFLGFIGIIYVNFLLGYILLFDTTLHGEYLIWLVFIIAWSTDTFAYFTGLYLGKRKLCPTISPKKTIEGSIGGIVGSLVICTLFGMYLNNVQGIQISLFHFVILGIITSIISQLGDLSASLIKRNYEIKDFGKIFPGHGGILDRFDSIIFAAPIVYYYINIFI